MLVSECLKFQGRLYAPNDETRNAICQLEWAYKVLVQPACTYPNGKLSWEVAGAIVDEFEDVLLEYERFTA